jgi:DNA-directed RNA polymerase beta' subunit
MEISLKEINSITFGIYSPEEIINQSVVKIDSNKLHGENSVYDERMGILENNKLCASCGQDCKDCPGHFGHIELNVLIMHPMYHRHIVNFLKCFCFKCYRFLLTEDHLKLDGIMKYQREIRFDKILTKLEKIDKCCHSDCECAKPKIIYSATDSKISIVLKKDKRELMDDEIKKIFDNVKDEDVELLGFDPKLMHPKNLILSVIPVLPPISRPYVVNDNATCDDDLTLQYIEIIKANNHLKDENLDETKKTKHIQTLKFRLKTLMNNSQAKARHTNGRPLKAIKERISGKEGLIRWNLMGKRVNQSGRTVIGPDPTVRTDELVVPDKIAKNLSVPERVTPENLQYLLSLVNNNLVNYVLRPDNKKEDGKMIRFHVAKALEKKGTQLLYNDLVKRNGVEVDPFRTKNFLLQKGDIIIRDGNEITDVELPTKKFFQLKIGDVVERQLRNGDIVILNRQPTLHKASMLAKRVIIRPYKTFRFALASTKTFNADFDGDYNSIII